MSQKLHPLLPVTVLAVATMAMYIGVYQMQPLGETTWNEVVLNWNDVVLNFSYGLVASLGAIIATRIWRQFAPTDRPRAVWRYFALALWMWAVAELVWALCAAWLGEAMPLITLADVFWLAGVGFFVATLAQQYRLVFCPPPERERQVVIGALVAVGLASVVCAVLFYQFVATDLQLHEVLLEVFYPLSDLAVAAAALALVRVFGWGLWGRPWLALLVFAASDALYAGLEITGIYSALSASGNVLSLLADLLYFGAYVVLALACYSQWLLVRHGPTLRRAPEK